MRTEDGLPRELQIRPFGRKGLATAIEPRSAAIEDFKLFALTFAGGFLFMTVFLA